MSSVRLLIGRYTLYIVHCILYIVPCTHTVFTCILTQAKRWKNTANRRMNTKFVNPLIYHSSSNLKQKKKSKLNIVFNINNKLSLHFTKMNHLDCIIDYKVIVIHILSILYCVIHYSIDSIV